LGLIVAQITVAAQYMPQIWRGVVVLSVLWFLHRWKRNVFSCLPAAQQIAGLDREKFLTLDKISSVGLFVLGGMDLAEACGVAVQSILTIGGIGGIATAIAARDILSNMLTGLLM
jgi:small-conductance mechanosensitive channel